MLNSRTLQGFLAITPFVLFILIFVGYFMFIFSMVSDAGNLANHNGLPPNFLTGMGMVLLIAFLTAIISLLSLVYFLIHAAKNPNLEQNNMRVVWILIIVLVSGIGNLIYWIAEIETKKPRPVIQ